MPRFNATWHWAKLEVPEGAAERKKLQARLSKRYPVAQVRRTAFGGGGGLRDLSTCARQRGLQGCLDQALSTCAWWRTFAEGLRDAAISSALATPAPRRARACSFTWRCAWLTLLRRASCALAHARAPAVGRIQGGAGPAQRAGQRLGERGVPPQGMRESLVWERRGGKGGWAGGLGREREDLEQDGLTTEGKACRCPSAIRGAHSFETSFPNRSAPPAATHGAELPLAVQGTNSPKSCQPTCLAQSLHTPCTHQTVRVLQTLAKTLHRTRRS